MSGTFIAPIYPLSLPSANHKHYRARSKTPHEPHISATPFVGITDNSRPSSLAHDLLAKYSAAKWLKKQKREYVVNHEIRQAKHEAAKAEEVSASIAVSERRESDATLEGKMTAAFSG